MKISTSVSRKSSPSARRSVGIGAVALAVKMVCGTLAYAELPTGGTVISGAGQLSQSGDTLTVNQHTARMGVEWESFNVGAGQRVQFVQPDANSVALNRVIGNDGSKIMGSLDANGKVFLVNPNGVLFGKDAQVNTGGLVASTLGISDADFAAGNYRFTKGASAGSVVNNGNLSAGSVVLIAPTIDNTGSITTPSGNATLAAGESVTVSVLNNGLITAQVNTAALNASIKNSGRIVADGGAISLQAGTADAVLDSLINTDGLLQARGVEKREGRIFLGSGAGGTTYIGGTLDTTGNAAGQHGGEITALGKNVGVIDGAMLDASGATGGGTVLVGGDWQGGGNLHQATTLTMGAGASIDVSATQNGNGGAAVLWSDLHAEGGSTDVHGSISARGGSAGGNGGRIETSGHVVDVSGLRVDAEAAHGSGGSWLIDPYNYTIDASAATSIKGALNLGTSVTVTTTTNNTGYGSDGSGAGNLAVASAIAKTAGGDATLTLQADNRLQVMAPISSSSGRLNVVLWSDYSNSNQAGVTMESDITITTNGGHLWAGGSSSAGGSQTWNGLTVGNGPSVGSSSGNYNGMDLNANITTSGGDVLLWAGTGYASAGLGPGIGLDGARTINAGSGDVAIIADRVFGYQGGTTLTINTTGRLSLAPEGGAYNAAFDWSGTFTGNNFKLNNTLAANALIVNNMASLTGLSIGRYTGMSGVTPTSTSNISNTSPITVAGGIELYGGQINVTSNLTSTGTGDIFIKSLSSANPSININADILKTGGARSTLTLQGQGRVTLQSGKKIQATGTALDTVFWTDFDNTNTDGGVSILGNVTTNGGHVWAGGSASNGGTYTWNGLAVGDGPSVGYTSYNNNAIDLFGTVNTSGGDILLWAGSGAGAGVSGIGSNNTGTMNAGAGSITLIADTIGGTFPISTTGTLSIAPEGGSFPSAFTWSGSGATDFTLDGSFPGLRVNSIAQLGGLTIGRYSGMSSGGTPVTLGNTSDITISSAINIPGAINLYGGNIAINAGLTATGSNTITLQGSGTVTDGASGFVSATNLLLSGGNVTLDSASNAVGTLAASGVGGFTYIDSDTLVLGTVGSTNGVSATGVVDVGTLVGDLSLLQNVSTTNASNLALTLNAGVNANANTSAGGNLFVFNGATVGVGAAGTARLFSGSVADSGGLTSLIGSGSGRFRYSSDESTTNYTLGLGTGLHAIYREQPTVTRVVDNQSIVYGNALPTWTFTLDNELNGDTYAQAISDAPTVSIGGAMSTSNHAVVGDHILTGTGGSATSQLGYAVNPAISAGTLTVTPRALTVTYTADPKVYDGGMAAIVTDSDNRITNDIFTIAETGAFADVNAGVGKTVNITDISLSGTDAANYTLTSLTATTTADITPRTVTLSGNRVYDGTTMLGAGTVTLGNLVGSEELGYSDASASNAHVATSGKYINALTLLDGTNGGLASNYRLPTLNLANAPLTITARAINALATIGGTLSKVYDGTTAANGASVSGSVTGAATGDAISLDLSGLSLAYNSANVVSATNINATGTVSFSIDSSSNGSQASDYSFTAPAIAPVAGTIDRRGLIVTVAAEDKVYDGTTVATGTVSGITGLLGSDIVESDGSATFAFADKHVDNNKAVSVSGMTLTGADAANYQVASVGASSASITPKELTLAAVSDIKVYDRTTTSSASVSLSGLATGDTATASQSFDSVNAGSRALSVDGYAIDDGNDGGNYTITTTQAAGTITRRDVIVNVAANDKVYDGGTAAIGTVSGITGVLAGDTIASDGTATFAFADKHVGNNKAVSVSGMTLSGTDAANYQVASVGASTASITPKMLTLDAVSDLKVYDRSTSSSGTVSVDGLVAGDTFTASQSFDSVNAGSRTLSVDAGYVVVDGNGGHNYTVTTTGAAGTITRRDVSVSVVADDKVYDGTTVATGTVTATGITGVLAGDTVVSDGSASFAFADKHVGTNKAVSISGMTLGGADAANYQIAAANASDAAITPATLVVTAVPGVKTYGDLDPALTYGYSGLQGTDDASVFSGVLSRASGENVGVYAIGQGTLLAGNDYVINYTDAGFRINPATLTVGALAGSKVYGDADPTLNYNVSGLVNGDTTVVIGGALARTSGENVGSYTIGLGSLSGGGNYVIAYTGNAFDITRRTLSIDANDLSKLYGDVDPSLSFSHGTLVNGDTDAIFSGSLTRAAGENVGHYGISQGTLSAGNNYDVQFTGGDLSITPRTLTLLANSRGKSYGDLDPVLSFSHGTLVNGDTDAIFSGALTRAAGENVGDYVITQGTLSAGSNYTIDFTGNNFEISTGLLVVNADARSKVYGDLDPSLTYIFSGLQNGDTASVFSGALSRASGENVGNYAINLGTLEAGSNYTLQFHSSDLEITRRDLFVTADAASKLYGALDPTLTYAYAGLVNGDTASVFTGALGRAAGENVNSYAIVQSTLSAGNNYSLHYTGNTFAITPAMLSVAANAQTKVYGELDPTLTYTYAGFVNGDTSAVFSGDLARAAGETVLVGPYAIGQGSLSAGGNYVIDFTGSTLAVTPKALTVDVANNLTKVYDGATALLPGTGGYSWSGRVGGDDVSVLGTLAFDSRNVGARTISLSNMSLSGVDAGNYSLPTTSATGSGAITARAITVSAQADSKVYDGTTSSSAEALLTGGSLVMGDTASWSQSFDDRNAGTGKMLTANGVIDDGNGGNNYDVTFVSSHDGLIERRALTVSAQADTKVYDGTVSSSGSPVITHGSFATGDSALWSQSFADAEVGTGKTLSASGAINDGNGGGNYDITLVSNTDGVILAANDGYDNDPRIPRIPSIRDSSFLDLRHQDPSNPNAFLGFDATYAADRPSSDERLGCASTDNRGIHMPERPAAFLKRPEDRNDRACTFFEVTSASGSPSRPLLRP